MWQVIVPFKRWEAGKSRLDLPSALRTRYAEAMAIDTLVAIEGSPSVGWVVALATWPVSDDSAVSELCDQVLVQPEGMGLNEALTWAVEQQPGRRTGTAVVVADLPALRPSELTTALTVATGHDRSTVADRTGFGTTLLAVTGDSPLAPRLGPGSAARHRDSGAAALEDVIDDRAIAGLRCDVDTLADLRIATDLGLGGRTQRVALGSLS